MYLLYAVLKFVVHCVACVRRASIWKQSNHISLLPLSITGFGILFCFCRIMFDPHIFLFFVTIDIYFFILVWQIENLLADIGGQLGLWIGVSVLTVTEVLELLSSLLYLALKNVYDPGRYKWFTNVNGVATCKVKQCSNTLVVATVAKFTWYYIDLILSRENLELGPRKNKLFTLENSWKTPGIYHQCVSTNLWKNRVRTLCWNITLGLFQMQPVIPHVGTFGRNLRDSSGIDCYWCHQLFPEMASTVSNGSNRLRKGKLRKCQLTKGLPRACLHAKIWNNCEKNVNQDLRKYNTV